MMNDGVFKVMVPGVLLSEKQWVRIVSLITREHGWTERELLDNLNDDASPLWHYFGEDGIEPADKWATTEPSHTLTNATESKPGPSKT
jgi:hypothetical protein